MSGFIATEPSATTSEEIGSGPFWPAFTLAGLREVIRIDGTVTDERLRAAALAAISQVNRELSAWRELREADGAPSLDKVDAQIIGGEHELVMLYRRAVASLTSAQLRERYRDFDATGDGHQAADRLETPIDDLRRDARWAIRDILGLSRMTVELI